MDTADPYPPAQAPALPPRRAALRAGCALVASAVALGWPRAVGAAPEAKRVLIVHSFGRDIAPYDAVIATFRRELASQAPWPIVFLEAALDAARAIGADEEAAFVAYLEARFAQPGLDLVVGSGPAAAHFLVQHRSALFAQVPLLLTAFNARLMPRAALRPGDAVVATTLDLRRVFETAMQVLPETRTIAVVIGASALERFWRREAERDSAFLAGQVDFVWFDDLSLAQMQQRVAALPPHSVVLYGLLIVDAAGVPHERLEALTALKQVANAPILSLFENELGQGVLGGPYLAQSRAGREAAQAALRCLTTPGVGEPVIRTMGMQSPVHDGRELLRWHIDESRLPPDSEVRFREAPLWAQHRKEIAAVAVVIAAQAALIGALLVQRARRRRAEQEARTLGGRLITAYEDEGRRLARELHDDITQRLAGVSIEAATLGRLAGPAARAAAEQSISGELAALSRDVHALSYRLHPSVIDDLGLEEALRIECGRIARRGKLDVALDADAASAAIRGERALCLFRVAQEALRNAERHAQASRIRVELRSERGVSTLQVSDDGRGFEPEAERERASLGVASMHERVVLQGGRLLIRSRRGEGTRVTAWLPAGEAAS